MPDLEKIRRYSELNYYRYHRTKATGKSKADSGRLSASGLMAILYNNSIGITLLLTIIVAVTLGGWFGGGRALAAASSLKGFSTDGNSSDTETNNRRVTGPDSSLTVHIPVEAASDSVLAITVKDAPNATTLPEIVPKRMPQTLDSSSPEVSKEVQQTFDLLEGGYGKVVLTNTRRDIILILGSEDSEKSDIVQFLSRNNSGLISVETAPDSEKYFIQNGDEDPEPELQVYPELYIDQINGLTFYDCPNFADVPSLSTEFPAAYFTKAVTDHARSFKLLVVITYSAVTPGNHRKALVPFVIRVAGMVQSFEKYKNSVALIVTDVENEYSRKTNNYISDDIVIRNIGDFIKKEVESYIDQHASDPTLTEEDQKVLNNAWSLIEALTSVDSSGEYNKIGLFRRPDEPGSIDQSAMLQRGKAHILKLIQENLVHQSKAAHDFRYSASGSVADSIEDLTRFINAKATAGFRALSSSLTEEVQAKITNNSDWETLRVQLKSQLSRVNSLITQLNATTDPMKYFQIFEEQITQFGAIESSEIENFKKYGNYISFAQEFGGDSGLLTVGNPLQGFQERLEQAGNWYDLLFSIHSTLSAYKYQNDTSLYNVANLTNWGIPGSGQGLLINNDNFAEFLNLTLTGCNTTAAKSTSLTTEILSELNSVIRNTLQAPDPVIEVINGTLTVRGAFVSFRKIKSQLESTTGLAAVKIYAKQTLFIDDNIQLPGISLSIFAPNWEIIGNRSVSLDGVDNIVNLGRADAGAVGLDGKAGLTGGQGGTAGSFLGVGKTFENTQGLHISARGGKGGKGQDGGDGGEGISGTEAPFPPKDPMLIKVQPGGRYGVPSYPVGVMGIDWLKSKVEEVKGWESILKRNFIVYGTRGQRGRRGGDGGSGGLGGFGGDVQLVGLDKGKSAVSVDNRPGERGEPGLGGQGGVGGRDGTDIKVAWVETTRGFGPTVKEWHFGSRGDIKPVLGSGPPGAVGTVDDTAYNHLQSNQLVTAKQNWPHQINGFKQYLRQNMADPVTKSNLVHVIRAIETNSELTSLYDAVGLLDDFNSLEKQRSEPLGPNLQDSYESLLLRVEAYAQATSDEDDMSRRKALAYLYTALQAKVYGFKLQSEIVSIPNLEDYIETTALKNIEGLIFEGRIAAFRRQNQEYVSRLLADVAEIQDFNDQIVVPNIETAVAGLDTQVKLKLGSSNDPESARELQQHLVWSSLFQTVKGVSRIVTFIGSAAEGVIDGTGDSIDEIFLLDTDRSGQLVPKAVPRGLKRALTSLNDGLETQIEDQASVLRLQIDEITEIIRLAPERMQDLKIRVEGFRSKLDFELNSSATSFEKMLRLNELSDQLRNAFRDKQASLATVSSLKSTDMIRVDNAIHSMQAAAFGIQQYGNVTIESFANALTAAEPDLRRIRKIQNSVYSTLAVMFIGINENIADMNRTLGTIDQVGLDVKKWKVDATMSSLTESLQELKRDFRVDHRYAESIDELRETLVKLRGVYKRIETVKQQKALINFVANLESPGSTSIDLSGTRYGPYVAQLDESIKSSLILIEVAPVVSAFQQFVFPFADNFADSYVLPQGNDMVTQALAQVRQLQQQLKTYRKGSVSLADFVETTEEPFYRWNHLEFYQEINDLLSGMPVTLHADIRNNDKEALKVKLIEVQLELSDSSRQAEFDSILQNYNVEFTHDGNSYYSYQGEHYLISTKRTTIGHSFLRGPDRRPRFTNEAYKKVVNGDAKLSPFAFWTIQIIPLNWRGFQDLEKFAKAGVNLLLAGEGTYIVSRVNGTRIPDLHLDSYYK